MPKYEQWEVRVPRSLIGISSHPRQPTIPRLRGGDAWQRYRQKCMDLECKGQLEIHSICPILWGRGSSNCAENQDESRVKSRAAALERWKLPTVPVDEFVVYQGRRNQCWQGWWKASYGQQHAREGLDMNLCKSVLFRWLASARTICHTDCYCSLTLLARNCL